MGNPRNYDLFSSYSYHVPAVGGMFMLLGWLLVGAVLGNVITMITVALLGMSQAATEYAMLISYPIMFLPAMVYAGYKSKVNALFEPGYALDSNHFKPVGGFMCAVIAVLATLAASFATDPIMNLMPEMPEWLEESLGLLTGGNIWIDFLCACIFAPFFEEWLCRGMILRGLLNSPHKNKMGVIENGIKPVWAIVISAAFFAVIHANPWQAIPAFLLGCLFGYVYYKTGSLKLTMLMHFTNNTFAIVLSHTDRFADTESWLDVMNPWLYAAVILFSIAFLFYAVSKFSTIQMQNSQGSCDKICD